MSRMGNIPVAIPAAVKLEQNGQVVKVTGPKGTLTVPMPDCIQMENKDGKVHLTRKDDTKQSNVLHGTTRSLLNGAVIGVTEGYKRHEPSLISTYSAMSRTTSITFFCSS